MGSCWMTFSFMCVCEYLLVYVGGQSDMVYRFIFYMCLCMAGLLNGQTRQKLTGPTKCPKLDTK